MRTEVETITPQRAKELFDNRSPKNRDISQALIKKYSHDMKTGNWKVTHQAIALNEDGRLIDGQNRMLAVIEAGVPVEMLVAYDVPDETMMGIDIGLSRRAHDVLSIIYGYRVDATRVATARAMMSLPYGKTAKDYSVQDIADFLMSHKEAIDFTANAFTTKKRGITRSAMMAAFARAYYHCDHERLLQFAKSLMFGTILDEKADSAAVRLREYALSNVEKRNLSGDLEYYRKTERALTYYCERKHMTKLDSIAAELFTIPGEEGLLPQ